MKETNLSKRIFCRHRFVTLAGLLIVLQGVAFGETCHYAIAGDLNNDCKVNFHDIAVMALNWLTDCNVAPEDSACIPLDVDGDGYVVSVDCNDHDPNINPGATEIIDGIDNNCNGEIDEGSCPPDATPCDDGQDCTYDDIYLDCVCNGIPYSCEDGISCTIDMCSGDGNCETLMPSDRCLIEGACYLEGDLNPAASCEECNSAMNPFSWSHVPDGTSCSDSSSCTVDDTCSSGVCNGIPYSCDDGISCTIDMCSGDGNCETLIRSDWCLIEGACYHEGALNPAAPCEECNSATDPLSWSHVSDGTPCNDSSSCTVADTCTSGVCIGAPIDCDDDNPCTKDACSPGTGCTYEPADGIVCDDGDSCTTNDTCLFGTCTGTPIDCDDNNPCTIDSCNSLKGCTYEPADGTPCGLGNVCQDGECVPKG